MKCPVCSDANLVMSERQGIEIDYCPQCRGIWLDRGELDKIMERSAIQQQSQPKQYPSPSDHHHHTQPHGHKPYRKKSFFEELFD